MTTTTTTTSNRNWNAFFAIAFDLSVERMNPARNVCIRLSEWEQSKCQSSGGQLRDRRLGGNEVQSGRAATEHRFAWKLRASVRQDIRISIAVPTRASLLNRPEHTSFLWPTKVNHNSSQSLLWPMPAVCCLHFIYSYSWIAQFPALGFVCARKLHARWTFLSFRFHCTFVIDWISFMSFVRPWM